VTAISKSFVTISDGAVDPDSPGTTTLFTGIRDSLIHLREWIGAGFYAGAVQDHNHDGSNSALVPVGPNMVRNGSFEQDTGGWTITTYTGGSSAVETANDAHGAKSLSFTSTVLANGGGDAVSNEFLLCGGSVVLRFEVWRKGSAINIASKAEVIWYDDAQAQISVVSIYTDTNTPTTATRARAGLTSPSTARFFKIKLTGGTPGAGSSTGTIYFDGVNVSDWTMIQAYIESGAVGQAQLKSTTGQVSTTTGPTNFTLPGGEYGFYPQVRTDAAGEAVGAVIALTVTSTSFVTNIRLDNEGAGSFSVYAQQRYIQASPPYDLGDGEVPLFVFAMIDSLGKIVSTYVAADPPWANNGPTNIRADFIDGSGRAFKLARPRVPRNLLLNPDTRDAALATLDAPPQLVEITQAMKRADMPLIPHPFQGNDLAGMTIVLLDPVSRLTERLLHLNDSGESVAALLHEDYLRLGNTPLVRAGPPGVMPVAVNWKLT